MNSKSSVVSFDIWGTLFESNPNFKKKREQFIRKTLKDNKFFKSGKFLESIDIFSILEAIKKDIDAVVELYGLSPQPTQLYTGFFHQLVTQFPLEVSKDISPERILAMADILVKECNSLIKKPEYQPNLIVDNTKDLLLRLIDSEKKLVVMSNTMNLSGDNLRTSLEGHNIGKDIFDEMLFSDEVGASKPSPAMYGKLLEYGGKQGVGKKNITHIGDNNVTDGQAKNYGMNFLSIDPKKTSQDLSAIVSHIIDSKKSKYKVNKEKKEKNEVFEAETRRVAAKKFSCKEDLNFSPEEYSRFKFGSKQIARKFGEELADALLQSKFFEEIVEKQKQGQELIVVSSPYLHIPTATFTMKDYFVNRLNQTLAEKHMKPTIEVKMNRTSTYPQDYGEMSAKERSKIIDNDMFHIDHDFIRGNVVLFLDDIIITGGHEKGVLKMLKHYNLIGNITPVFLYYAMLTNNETDPTIENYLNYGFVKDLVNINDIIQNEPFAINTRTVKYILNSPKDEFETFLKYQNETFLQTLYSCALGNKYHEIPEYQKNMEFLKNFLKNKFHKKY